MRSEVMDDMLKESGVLTDAKENRYSPKSRSEEVENKVSQREEAFQSKFINSSRGSLTHGNIDESQLKELVASQQVNADMLRQGHICEEKQLEEGNSSNTSQQPNQNESSQKDTNSTTNGSPNMEPQISLNIFAFPKLQEARHLGTSLSDEDSLSCLSESRSSELNTNGIGTDDQPRIQKDDFCISSTRQELTPKESSEFNDISRGSKKKISFRALVRMKGLGKKLRKNQQGKSKQKHIKTDCNNKDLFFSDSSAKYLLESSTSVTDEQSIYSKQTIKDNKLSQSQSKKKSYSYPETTTSTIFQNLDSNSSSEQLCTSEYLENRRCAVCEELEQIITCGGEQTLAELRSILVIQHKLTGFGLL